MYLKTIHQLHLQFKMDNIYFNLFILTLTFAILHHCQSSHEMIQHDVTSRCTDGNSRNVTVPRSTTIDTCSDQSHICTLYTVHVHTVDEFVHHLHG